VLVHSLPNLSLYTWVPPVGADLLARARPLPLFSLCPVGPPCQRCSLVHALPPADPWASPVSLVPLPTVRAHDSVHVVDSASTTHAEATTAQPRPFLASRTPTHSPSLSRTPCRAPAPTSHRASARETLSPSAESACSFCCHHRGLAVLVASVSSALTSATRDVPQLILSPSGSLCPCSLDLHRAAGVPSSSTRALVVSLPPFKGPRVISQGNQPSPAPNFPFLFLGVRNCSPEQGCAAVEPSLREQLPSGASALSPCPRPCSPRCPKPPRALPGAPGPPTRPCLWRVSSMDTSEPPLVAKESDPELAVRSQMAPAWDQAAQV
jgi:hypothetical protein